MSFYLHLYTWTVAVKSQQCCNSFFHHAFSKTCCTFTAGLTRLLPCTGASRTASWLFETWFGAAGGGRDGHSSVHSREGREGNVTCFTTVLWAPTCTHTGSVGFKQTRHEKHGKRGNRVTARWNKMNGMFKTSFEGDSMSRSTDRSAGTPYFTLKVGTWFAFKWSPHLSEICSPWPL